MQYFGTRLSKNISRREPEGYLLCLNVPVARTGVQEYLAEELGLPPVRGDPGALIPVYRPAEEVFDPATIASFEGMPVTNDHPPEGVTLENIRYLQKGHAHHIRRGTGEEADLLLADLIITDPGLIEAILHEGKREISCGYMYELCEEEGKYVQRNIRGNHIAVVDSGRAGPRVSIRDHYPMAMTSAFKMQRFFDAKNERRGNSMNKALYKKLVKMARDGDAEAVEAVAELMEQMIEEEGEAVPVVTAEAMPVVQAAPGAAPVVPAAAPAVVPAPVVAVPDPANVVVGYPAAQAVVPAAAPVAAPVIPAEQAAVVTVPEGHEVTVDSDLGAAILEKLDQLIALLTPAAVDEEPGEGEKQDPVQEIVEAVTEAVEAGEAVSDPVAEVVAEFAEGAEGDPVTAQIAEMIQEVMEPSTVLEPEETLDCDEPPEGKSGSAAADAVRAVLKTVKPMIASLPEEKRAAVCAAAADRIRKTLGGVRKGGGSSGDYLGLAARGRDRKAEEPNALGKRIMAKRNANMKG